MAKLAEHSRWLAAEAARCGWRHAPSGDALKLWRRWNWHSSFEHPFELQAQSTLGVARYYNPIADIVSGARPNGRPFWALWYTLSDNVPHGFANRVRRSVAFIYTARSLPMVSVSDRNGTGRGGANFAQGILAGIRLAAARNLEKRPDADPGRPGLVSDWAIGDEEFHSRYRVRAYDGRAAEWLAGPAIQQALLTHQPATSLTSNGADILAWTDYGWTDCNGITDYRGEHIRNLQDLDIITVEGLLAVLDIVPLL